MNQNPILGDRYEYKLKLLQNNIDLAQQGKLTYEPLSNSNYAELPTDGDTQSLNEILNTSQLEGPTIDESEPTLIDD